MVSFGKKYFVESKKGDVWFCELYLLDLQIRGWWGWASPGGERARATGMPRDPPVRPTRTIPRRRPRVIERATARGVGRHTPTWRQRKNKEDDNTCRAESHRRRRSRSADTTPPSSSPAIGGRLRGQRGFTRVKLWEIAGKGDRCSDLGCSARAFADLARASRRHGGVRPDA